MTDRIYLDHAATTPLKPAARRALAGAMDRWANPSSPHAEGRAARAALEEARAALKARLGWRGEVVFTSGASEALRLALTRHNLPETVVSAVEHDAVLGPMPAAPRLPVGADGLVDPDALPGAPALVAVQQVNSETGVIQPIDALAAAARARGGLLLTDCAQGAGKQPLPDADMIVLSAHKFGGPVGVGALLLRDWAMLSPDGGQEAGYRRGTENLPAIAAMVAALEGGFDWVEALRPLRDGLDAAVTAAGGTIIAAGAPRSPLIASYAMPHLAAAAQLIRLDAAGFAVSAGSACSSGTLKPSHVLAALGIDSAVAARAIRVSFGWTTTPEEVAAFAEAWTAMVSGSVARGAGAGGPAA